MMMMMMMMMMMIIVVVVVVVILVGGLVAMNFIFPYIGNLIIPIDSYFSEGWPNHQPAINQSFWGTPTIHEINHPASARLPPMSQTI